MSDHKCAYPASGCTNPDCNLTATWRVAEFARQWAIAKDRPNDIHSIHFDVDAEPITLRRSDLLELVALSKKKRGWQ